MGDVLKSVSGGWPFVVSWVLPSGLFWAVFALFVLPEADSLPVLREITATSATNQTLVLAGAAALTGLVLNALSTVLYRLLEGYYLPRRRIAGRLVIWEWMRDRQLQRKRVLATELKRLTAANPADRVAEGLVRERLQRYPADDAQFGPTAFANAMRALETYGWDRFRLDSQTLWSELMAVAPENLREEEESARTPVNLSVSLTFLSLLTALTCAATTVADGWSTSLAVVGLLALALVPFWYRLAVLNTRYLSSVVRASVNLGRAELAKKLGLSLPATLKEEREMWLTLFWTVDQPFDEAHVADLDDWRATPADDAEPDK